MSSVEDRVRAAMAAAADLAAEEIPSAPPLRLPPGPTPLERHVRPPRRWIRWGAPLTAAAAVVALAASLVTIKDVHNGPSVPGKETASATAPVTIPRYTRGTEGVPRYYLGLKQFDSKSARYSIVAGDSVTGKTLATFAPPANTTFQDVSAAADDRTFTVVALTSSTGSFGFVPGHATLTASWYKVRLTPGTAHPATLNRLPIKTVSWVTPSHPEINPRPGQIFATALSESGQELAVADIPDIPAADASPRDWQEVKVFSTATGQLLRDWIGHDPTSNLSTAVDVTFTGIPPGTPDLTWIDEDQALALATSYQAAKTKVGASKTVTGMVRRLNVAGSSSGNLIADGTVLWSGTLSGAGGCLGADWPPQLSADGAAITCVTDNGPGSLSFDTEPLAAGTTGSTKPTVAYQVKATQVEMGGWLETNFLWVSPSADAFIVQWVFGGSELVLPNNAQTGVVSHGKFTPLRTPKSLALSAVDITFLPRAVAIATALPGSGSEQSSGTGFAAVCRARALLRPGFRS